MFDDDEIDAYGTDPDNPDDGQQVSDGNDPATLPKAPRGLLHLHADSMQLTYRLSVCQRGACATAPKSVVGARRIDYREFPWGKRRTPRAAI